jgi:hypothetical protein
MDDELIRYQLVVENQFNGFLREYRRPRLIILLKKCIKLAVWLNLLAGREWLDGFPLPRVLYVQTLLKGILWAKSMNRRTFDTLLQS